VGPVPRIWSSPGCWPARRTSAARAQFGHGSHVGQLQVGAPFDADEEEAPVQFAPDHGYGDSHVCHPDVVVLGDLPRSAAELMEEVRVALGELDGEGDGFIIDSNVELRGWFGQSARCI
jgi:hypothetical protein